ncbi:TPA: RHS repeat protein [Escherichia coli]|nr:RHS repeat protein [Escherichia coli]
MSGKPAARQGDMTQYGGSIVQGSAGVRIGAPTGVACSVCPGGVTSGHPVNPLLGAKVLPGETDLALPGPLPFILSRTYSSYRTKTPAPVGSLGPGWKMPADIRLQLRDNTLILSDNGGRSLYFEHLFPGEDGYSRSESLWLVRGGVLKLDEGHRLAALWQALPEELRLSPHRYLATNSPQGPWWVLGWCERVPEADEVLPAPLPPYRVLTGLVDRFGRTQTFHREAGGEFSGEITGVTDGAGRHFRLVLTTQALRAEEVRQQAISGGTEPSAFPDTLPGYTEYGRDNGIRLSAVWLTHDPEYPENLPAAPLVRYGWTPRGELAAVYEDGGSMVFPPVLVQMLDRLESEILADRVSEESRRWLASCGLTVAQMQNQMDPVYTPARKIHLYHCDHRGLPLALISTEGATEWCAEYDEWGNLLSEDNPHQLQQLIRLPGQQYDEESGLYYNRHRYYDPLQGRYITQDPIGLEGGWNQYVYASIHPTYSIDPLGLIDKPAPVFNRELNSDAYYLAVNNCYSYALNRYGNPGSRIFGGGGLQPGELSGKEFSKLTCSSIFEASKNDGAKDLDNGSCPSGYHKAQLFIRPHNFIGMGGDYHWYRQDANGEWSDKQGVGAIRFRGKDPLPPIDYPEKCGTICLPN